MKFSVNQQITFFYTRDIVRTSHFYEGVLGFELVIDQGSCRIYRVSQNGWVGFCQRDEAPGNPTGAVLTLVTDDVDGWYELLIGQGVVFEIPPQENPRYNIYHCCLRDPVNGFQIEIQKFL